MTTAALARRYAAALFDVARKKGEVDRAAKDLAAFADLIETNRELAAAFAMPGVAPAKKRALVDALVARAGDVVDVVRQLLLMLAERDRLIFTREIAAAFAERVRQDQHVVRAEITTAVPLGDERQSALAAALARAVDRKVLVTARVDPSIMGGAIARVGSVVYDGSIARQLARMKETLLAN